MAEFQEVMKQAKRMCKGYGPTCDGCALYSEDGCLFQNDKTPDDKNLNFLADAEKIVMDWAEKHPEPRYPSWQEAWMQLFPESSNRASPCPQYFLSNSRVARLCAEMECNECRDTPIPADIAEKLGVKPIGGASDENP